MGKGSSVDQKNENGHLNGSCPCPIGKTVGICDTQKPAFSEESAIQHDFSANLRNEVPSMKGMR